MPQEMLHFVLVSGLVSKCPKLIFIEVFSVLFKVEICECISKLLTSPFNGSCKSLHFNDQTGSKDKIICQMIASK